MRTRKGRAGWIGTRNRTQIAFPTPIPELDRFGAKSQCRGQVTMPGPSHNAAAKSQCCGQVTMLGPSHNAGAKSQC
ncbi:MAG: hypothetical protein OSA98_26170, partial [Rubripirellula sp.]|nr:hypothetical protein [Rubripirellula sp.]